MERELPGGSTGHTGAHSSRCLLWPPGGGRCHDALVWRGFRTVLPCIPRSIPSTAGMDKARRSMEPVSIAGAPQLVRRFIPARYPEEYYTLYISYWDFTQTYLYLPPQTGIN